MYFLLPILTNSKSFRTIFIGFGFSDFIVIGRLFFSYFKQKNRNQIAVTTVIISDANISITVRTLNGVILAFPNNVAAILSSRDAVIFTIYLATKASTHNKIVNFQITSFSS